MSNSRIREAAKQGDIHAISSLVSQAFASSNVIVEAEIKHGVALLLRIHSSTALDHQTCTKTVIETLNEIHPNRITFVLIWEMSPKNKDMPIWSKVITIKEGKFVDNTKTDNRNICIILAVLVFGISWIFLTTKPAPAPSTVTATPSQTQQTQGA